MNYDIILFSINMEMEAAKLLYKYALQESLFAGLCHNLSPVFCVLELNNNKLETETEEKYKDFYR